MVPVEEQVAVPVTSSCSVSTCCCSTRMNAGPSLHGMLGFMHNFHLEVAGEWPWHPCREPWICLPTKGLSNMQHMEIGKTTLIGKGTIPFGNIVVPLNSTLFILSSLLSHGGCQKPGPPCKAGSFPKTCLAWVDFLCEGLQGDVLLQRFLYDWKGCCEIGKECFQLRKGFSFLPVWSRARNILAVFMKPLCADHKAVGSSLSCENVHKRSIYSADGGTGLLEEGSLFSIWPAAGSPGKWSFLKKISALVVCILHHEFSHASLKIGTITKGFYYRIRRDPKNDSFFLRASGLNQSGSPTMGLVYLPETCRRWER